jgi:hypothetical protein
VRFCSPYQTAPDCGRDRPARVEQRRLAGAGRPGDGDDGAGLDDEIDTVETRRRSPHAFDHDRVDAQPLRVASGAMEPGIDDPDLADDPSRIGP